MTLAGLKKNPAFVLYHLLWSAADWLYPPECGGCNVPGERWCPTCQAESLRPLDTICLYCGVPLPLAGICPTCQSVKPQYSAIRAWGIYSGRLRSAIHRLKYKQDLGLAEALAHNLIELYSTLNWKIDMVIPVPLSRSRFRQRGYNQASLLGRPLALAFKLPFKPQALSRTRETNTQVGLNFQERQDNVRNAFKANTGWVKAKTILVIDDVATTGATMQGCAEALLFAGAKAVYGLTLARTAQPLADGDQPDRTVLLTVSNEIV